MLLKKRLKSQQQTHKQQTDVTTVVGRRYAVRLTPYLEQQLENLPDEDPVARQYRPALEELSILPQENPDPTGDHPHSPLKGLVHRHPDRVLLKPVHVCAAYCRFCFRREMVGPGGDMLDAQDLKAALSYIGAHTEIREVILTGGDPLMLSPRRLDELLGALEAMQHIEVLRIHTRLPMADPERITHDLGRALTREKPLYVALHINHARELAAPVRQAIGALHRAGCVLLGQSVLLKGVNDTALALEDLFRAMVSIRIKPYYLHHPDLAPGTSHFRVDIAQGQALMRALQGRVSGLCLPQYMLDIPGGFGKVPVGPAFCADKGGESWTVTDPKGRVHAYPPVAAKKPG